MKDFYLLSDCGDNLMFEVGLKKDLIFEVDNR